MQLECLKCLIDWDILITQKGVKLQMGESI